MAFQTFSLGKIDSSEDPDAAQELLDGWLEMVIPQYLESPEYQALSKVNKKAGGSWIHFFMTTYLGYFGGDLKDVDLEATQEIMEDLTPRKMICSDTQAKTIVPELIAFWSFLRRELGDKKLKHAASIVEYLTSIKKNYLKIYNREPEIPDFMKDLPIEGQGGLEAFDEMLESLLKGDLAFVDEDDDSDWIEPFIQEVADTLAVTGRARNYIDQWSRVDTPEKISELLEYICLGNVDDNISNRDEVMYSILGYIFENIFTGIRQKDPEAIASWKQMEQEFIDANIQEDFEPGVTDILFSVLGEYRQYLSGDFLAFIRNWKQNRVTSPAGSNPPSMEEVTQMMAAFFEEVPDEFVCATVLKEQFGLIPPAGLATFFDTTLNSQGEDAADALALWLLDGEQAVAKVVADALLAYPHLISSKTLGRLIRIRNWLPQPVQQAVDKIIRKVRQSGQLPVDIMPSGDIQDVYLSAVDGSGAQGVMILTRYGSDFGLSGFVLKENVGIVDAWMSPPGTKKEMQEVIKSARQRAVMERVFLDALKQLLPAFLSMNCSSGTAADHKLVQVLELIGMKNWNPEAKALSSFLPGALKAEPGEEEVQRVQERSKRWLSSAFGESWFGQGDLSLARDNWQERMVRMALWAHHANNKNRNRQSRDFAVVGWLLEQDIPLEDIELMNRIEYMDSPVF